MSKKEKPAKRLPVPFDLGWTPIPHQMIRNLHYFTPAEGMVLLLAYDITAGWHRTTPQPMSYRWVAEQTGMSINTVQKAIASLIIKGWIAESKKRGKRGVKLYKPVTKPQNIGYDLHNDETTVSKTDTVTVSNSDTVPYQKLIQHKEKKESTKENPPKPPERDPFDMPIFTDESRQALRAWKGAVNSVDKKFMFDRQRCQVVYDAIEMLSVERVVAAIEWASQDQYQSIKLTNWRSVRDSLGAWDTRARRENSAASKQFNGASAYPYAQFDGEGEGETHE